MKTNIIDRRTLNKESRSVILPSEKNNAFNIMPLNRKITLEGQVREPKCSKLLNEFKIHR